MSEWKEYKIGDMCLKVTDGAHNSPPEVTEGYPMFSVKDMDENGFDFSDVKLISRNDFDKLVKSDCKPLKNDVLIAKDGSYLKHVFVCKEEKEEVILSSIAILRPNVKIVNAFFLKYILKTSSVKNMMEGFVSGSALPRIVLKDFKKMVLQIPSVPTQHCIASILSAYDDLIENNNRRIALLEQMAEQIYKEWFVRMRFPGYQKTEFEKGVPKGWEVNPILTLCSKITDGTHDTPKPVDEGGVPLITGTHIVDGRIDFDSAYKISIDDHTKIKQRSYLDKGDIIFSNIGTIGSIAIVNEDFEYSVKNVIIFKPLSIEYSLFLYYMIKSPSVKEQLMLDSSGTSQKFITLGYIRKVKTVIPETELIKKFSQLVRPMFLEKSNLQLQTQTLKQTRDLLLPRLISGKLKVNELKEFELV